MTTNATLYEKLRFNFIRDIVPIAMIGSLPLVMGVAPSVPAKTVPEFIAYVKSKPGTISMASGGNGSMSHVGGELFKLMTHIDMLHVPYRGGRARAHRPDRRQGKPPHCFPRNADDPVIFEESASREDTPGSAWEAPGSVLPTGVQPPTPLDAS